MLQNQHAHTYTVRGVWGRERVRGEWRGEGGEKEKERGRGNEEGEGE